jgi:heme o synthase
MADVVSEPRVIVAVAPRASWRDYLVLTKPKVIGLLLFTAVGAMFVAAKGFPGLVPLLGLLVGGYMSAGAAGVFNMIYDRDIDARMKRTAGRPTVTALIGTRQALLFATGLMIASVLVIGLSSNWLASLLSLGGIAFYVLVYTIWLKRSTWQNIVIGGAAGAIPPLVGWAAVSGELSLLAWLLFALIFLWTPVHFWALALMIKEDYAAVGVPMAPVVIGEKRTVRQIIGYALLTTAAALLPVALGEFSLAFLAVAILLSVGLFRHVRKLYAKVERSTALGLYKYSMLYLALLFLAMALDRAFLV